MSERGKQVVITFFICMTVSAIAVLIFLAANNATSKTNLRLDHIGTACAKAGNLWIDNNCISSSQSPAP